jgi:hypothetical protein
MQADQKVQHAVFLGTTHKESPVSNQTFETGDSLFLLMTDLTAKFAIGRCIATDDDEADERNDE